MREETGERKAGAEAGFSVSGRAAARGRRGPHLVAIERREISSAAAETQDLVEVEPGAIAADLVEVEACKTRQKLTTAKI